jgi:predicted Zn-dependent protease
MTAAGPQQLVETALAQSSADGCVVIADEMSSVHLRWANSTLTTNGAVRERRLTVVATAAGATGTAAGVVSRDGVTLASVESVVRAAERAATQSRPAEDAAPLLATGHCLATGHSAACWDQPPAESTFGVFSELVPALGVAFRRARPAGRRLFGYAQHQMRSTYLGSSTGLRLRHVQPTGQVQINGKSTDPPASAWVGATTADFADVDMPALEAELVARLGWAGRQVELPAGRYETVLPPAAVADLMVEVYMAADARNAYDGHSVFSQPGGGTRIGTRLTDVLLTLRSDPAAPGIHCAPFVVARSSGESESVFDNGLGLAPTEWIRDGVLTALVQTRHSAALTGLGVTPRIDNLILAGPPGGGTVADLVADTRRGLLLTCLWYIREVDPRTMLLTGLTRDGVYLIERGEVVGAVNNFRFNDSPVDLLGRVMQVGGTEPALSREWSGFFNRTAMPALRVADFTMSAVSPAE